MKKIINCIALLLFLPSLTAQKNRAFEVKQVMERVADWQIANHNDLQTELKTNDSIEGNTILWIGPTVLYM